MRKSTKYVCPPNTRTALCPHFHGRYNVIVTWHQPAWSTARGCRSPAVTVIDFLCCVKRHSTDSQCFSMDHTKPQNCPFQRGISMISHFRTAHKRDWETQTHANHATPSVAVDGILSTECMRCGLKKLQPFCAVCGLEMDLKLKN